MVKIVDGYSFLFLCLLELVIPERKKKDLAIPMEIYKQGVSVVVLCVYVFLGRGSSVFVKTAGVMRIRASAVCPG